MRFTKRRFTAAIAVLLLSLSGCDLWFLCPLLHNVGGGTELPSDSQQALPAEEDPQRGAPAPEPDVNQAPVAHAYTNRTPAVVADTVQLNAARSQDPDGDDLTFAWEQTDGEPLAVLVDPTAAVASFVAPDVDAPTILTFTVSVSDGLLTSTASVAVRIVRFIPVGSFVAAPAAPVDNTPPTITSITSASGDDLYGVGAGIDVTVNFSEPVTLAGGTLDVTLDTGVVVNIAAFGPAATASGVYNVGAGENSADLDAWVIALGAGATLTDAAGNAAIVALPVGATVADLKDIAVDGDAPTLTAAASRKTHGAADVYDIALALDVANPTSESRRGGLTMVVLTFSEDVRAADATPDGSEVAVTVGAVDTVLIAGAEMQVTFTGIADKSCVDVTLSGIEDLAGNALTGDNDVRIIVLAGDFTGPYGAVSLADVAKSSSSNGLPLGPATAYLDVNCDGVIGLTDVAETSSRNGNQVLCP